MLDDAIPFPIVEILGGGSWTALRVLPRRQLPFGVPGELLTRGAAARAGGGAAGDAADHIPAGVVAGGVGHRAVAADARRGVQVGAVAIGVVAQGASGQAVERPLAEGLAVTRPAKGVNRRGIAAGVIPRIVALHPRPDQPVEVVVTERLLVGALRQGRADRRDVACRLHIG